MTATTPADQPAFKLWYAMLGAPTAWLGQFLLLWAVGEMGCRAGLGEMAVGDINLVRLLMGVFSAISLLVAAHAMYTAWGLSGRGAEGDEDYPAFMGYAGTLLGAVFVVAIIMNAVSSFVLPPCA